MILTSFAGIVITTNVSGQNVINYDVFSKDNFGAIRVNIPSLSSFNSIRTISTDKQRDPSILSFDQSNLSGISQQMPSGRSNSEMAIMPRTAVEVRRHNEQEANQMINSWINQELKKEVAIHSYKDALAHLEEMNPDNFSLTQAVYEVENAYLDNQLSKTRFVNLLQLRVEYVRQILRTHGLSAKNNLSINYAIQQLFQQNNSYNDPKYKVTFTIPPFKYDFDDYMGKEDYTKLFTAKLLVTGSGQCHSLPLVYLMIAEQLGAKAWLSLAPEHSFVQFKDARGRLLDYETTNGNIVSNSWIAGSGYINTKALRNKMYLDTLSQRKLYGRCLTDLLLGYLNKFGYDDFAQEIRNAIQKVDSTNITALIVDANQKKAIAFQAIIAAGTPKPEDLHNYAHAYQCYLDMKKAIQRIDDLGYQDMPSEAYEAWLKSIETEKKQVQAKKQNQSEPIRLEPKTKKTPLQSKKN